MTQEYQPDPELLPGLLREFNDWQEDQWTQNQYSHYQKKGRELGLSGEALDKWVDQQMDVYLEMVEESKIKGGLGV